MSCCGKKRTEWLNERKTPSSVQRIDAPTVHRGSEHQPGQFEYVGMQSLTVKGVHSGILYRFTYPGERIEVLYEDTFALMAEPDLKFVGPNISRRTVGPVG
jgi:hypothetical protein